MQIINASSARSNLFGLLSTISNGEEPKLIQSRGGDCVLMSKQDWDSIQETIFLLSNPKTRKDIEEGIATPLSECVRIEELEELEEL